MEKNFMEVKRALVDIKKEEQLKRYAQSLGDLEVVVGNSTTLLVDCDSEESFNTVVKNIQWSKSILGIQSAYYTRSKSRNWHVYIKLGTHICQRERTLLQAAIGGDFKRAMLEWRRTELTEPMGEATVRKLLTTGKKSEIDRGETVLFEVKNADKVTIDLGPNVDISYVAG